MTNKDLAEKIYSELDSYGMTFDSGKLSDNNIGAETIIQKILDKHNPEKEWQKLALEGLKSQATKSLWHELAETKGRTIGDVIRRVEAYMTENKVENKEE